MTATFKQDAISVRERLDSLECHHHDARYVQQGQVFGKNILINGDNSITQRGDFSAGVSVGSTAEVFVDRVKARAHASANATFTHEPYNSELGARTCKIVVGTSSSSVPHVYFLQIIENFQALQGKTVTFTAQVRTNKANSGIYISVGGQAMESSQRHSGNGQWETISMTVELPSTIESELSCVVSFYNGDIPDVAAGDYIEMGQVQLELGSEFTGFEVVTPADQLARCQRYYYQFKTPTYMIRWAGSTVANYELFTQTLPVTMREDPTATIKTNPTATGFAIGTLQFFSNLRVCTLKATPTAAGAFGIANDGVYALDAEL